MNNPESVQEHGALVVPEGIDTSSAALILHGEAFHRIEALATLMASGKSTIPEHLRGNKSDCFAVTMQAMQWGMNPYAVAQKTHLVKGTLGYEAQLVNAVITSRAPVKERLHYEWFGEWERILGSFVERESKTKKDDHGNPLKYRVPGWKSEDEKGLGVKVWATFDGESEPRVLTLLMTQASVRNSTLWADDPRQQLAYLATKRWARLYCPDVIMGVYTPDELADPAEKFMGEADVVDSKPAAAPQKPEKPHYSEVAFNADKDSVKKAVASGRFTIDQAIDRIKKKFEVSPEWEKNLRDYVSKQEPQAETPVHQQSESIISQETLADLSALADEYAIGLDDVATRLGIPSLAVLPANRVNEVVAIIKGA